MDFLRDILADHAHQAQLFLALWEASSAGELTALDEYLSKGGNIDLCHPRSKATLLHWASEHQLHDLVRALASRGADLNRRGCGAPPLHLALDSDIDCYWQSTHDGNPENYKLETAHLLVSLGADPGVHDERGRTAREFVRSAYPWLLPKFDAYFDI